MHGEQAPPVFLGLSYVLEQGGQIAVAAEILGVGRQGIRLGVPTQ